MPRPLRVDDRRFPSETLDGETVVIDAVAGRVCVFDGVGSTIWEALRVGADADELVQQIVGRFGSESGHPVTSFVDELVAEEMVLAVAHVDRLPGEIDWPSEFRAPTIERFDDLADLLTVDPIHDVDPATGWPRAE